MGTFTAGQVVIVQFPFSDLTAAKLRPALILADAGRGDWILSQITSTAYSDIDAIDLDDSDFKSGSLRVKSFVRPGKLFTAHVNLITGTAGALRNEKLSVVRNAVIKMIQGG